MIFLEPATTILFNFFASAFGGSTTVVLINT